MEYRALTIGKAFMKESCALVKASLVTLSFIDLTSLRWALSILYFTAEETASQAVKNIAKEAMKVSICLRLKSALEAVLAFN